jgi:UDP:flavonoid glycosyltransferase YjiC (YdhE family)
MRVLFTTWAQTGHYQPMVPLAWALRAAGHEVVVATHPAFAPVVTGSGVPALPVGPDIDVPAELRRRAAPPSSSPPSSSQPSPGGAVTGTATAVRTRDLPESRGGREILHIIVDGCAAMIDDALDYARAWRPDLVVFEPTGLVGPLVAELLGVPAVRLLWGPDFTAGLQRIAGKLMAPVLDRFGLSDLDVTGQVTLDPCPPRLRLPANAPDTVRREPMRFVGYHGPMTMPRRLLDPPARPRVCVTGGATLHTVGLRDAYLVPRIVRALAGFDVEVVVAAVPAQRELFDDLPDNVVHFGPVPLVGLLPTCAALIHHGGSGSTMSAVVSGVPQLVVTSQPEAVYNARQVAAAGAGLHLPDEEASIDLVPGCVSTLLDDPGPATAAHRLRAEALALPGPVEAVGFLTRLARRSIDTPAGAGTVAGCESSSAPGTTPDT